MCRYEMLGLQFYVVPDLKLAVPGRPTNRVLRRGWFPRSTWLGSLDEDADAA